MPTDAIDRLRHFTPLRYPGGKGKLAAFVKAIMNTNSLVDGEYVEPYAGGAAVALELLFHEYVSRIHINDISIPVYSFWRCVLDQPDELCKLILEAPMTVEEWERQKSVLRASQEHDQLAIAFAFFYLNRTNRSGILNGGIIGGKSQSGPWKMDARFNSGELVTRIKSIARLADRIELTNLDAAVFLRSGTLVWQPNTLIYCDPPYYIKGHELYYHYYHHEDHVLIASVMANISRQKWIVSYDNAEAIHNIYAGYKKIVYDIGYSARAARKGSEVMFFSHNLVMPAAIGAISEVSRHYAVNFEPTVC